MNPAALTDAELAARLAGEAGRLLREIRERGDLFGTTLGAAADAAANRYLCDAIRTARPHDALLSEEEKDNPARCGQSRVWIVDPLDGTREYAEGRDDWAVHVALAIDGTAQVGAVALPCLCELVWVLLRVYGFQAADAAAAVRALLTTANVEMNRPAAEAGLAVLEAGGDFADGVIAYEGYWLGGETFVSFDKKAVKLLAAQGQSARLL